MGLRLHHLRNLIALADAGSIRGAARTLKLSQSALTQSIGQLERDLDVPLVQRGARGSEFTPIGLELLERARAIEAELKRAEEGVLQLAGKFRGTLGIGVSLTASLTVIPGALNRIHQRYPNLQIRIMEGIYPPIIGSIRNGTLDLAVGPLPLKQAEKDLHLEALFEQEIVIAARRDHPLADKPQSLERLASEQWVVTGPSGAPGGVVASIFSQHRLPAPHVAVHSESTIALAGIIGGTNLLGTLPLSVFNSMSISGLRPLRLRERIPTLTIGIIRKIEPWPTPIAGEFIALLRKEAQRYRARRADPSRRS